MPHVGGSPDTKANGFGGQSQRRTHGRQSALGQREPRMETIDDCWNKKRLMAPSVGSLLPSADHVAVLVGIEDPRGADGQVIVG